MNNFSQVPLKTDSLEKQYRSSKINSEEFLFDFGNLTTNSDGTIKELGNDAYHKDKSTDGASEKSVVPSMFVIEMKKAETPIHNFYTHESKSFGRIKDEIKKNFTPWRISWCIASFLIFFGVSPFLALIVFLLQFVGFSSNHKVTSKRTIQWVLDDFSEQIKSGFLVSAPFLDKSGQWRMVILQKRCIDGLQTTFGLIATALPQEVELVTATIEFSCSNELGQQLSPGFKSMYFQHSFAVVGDCGYSRAIILSRRQLGEHGELQVKCRVVFERQEIGYFREIFQRFIEAYDGNPSSKRSFIHTRNNNSMSRGTSTMGEIFLQKHFQQGHPCDIMCRFSPMTEFIQHPESRTFVWEIPKFSTLLKNSECWGFFSPQFFVNSHAFCSIWRMKLFELLGVFRLHVQLRGLPGGITHVKSWHLITLVANSGDAIVPENSNPRVKYPDYLNLWGVNRHILYRRETLLERFVSAKDILTIRIALQVEPNDFDWVDCNGSDNWIRG